MSAALIGSHARPAGGAAAAQAGGETVLELTYACQLAAWLAVQPDLQYVIRPGGLRAARNAWVLGLRIAVSR